MMRWEMSVLEPICTQCGADCSALISPEDLDWRDDHERMLGEHAVAVALHTHIEHPVVPDVGDVVVYWAPWRGLWCGHGPYIVRKVSVGTVMPPWYQTRYWLVDAERPGTARQAFPSTNDMSRPITFEILQKHVEPVRPPSLFDMLGVEWAAAFSLAP